MKESVLKRAKELDNGIALLRVKLDHLNNMLTSENLHIMVDYLTMEAKICDSTNKLFLSCVRELVRKERNACQYEIEKYRKELEAL